MKTPVLTLREAMSYNPDTGLLTWKVRPIHHFKNDDRWSAQQCCDRWNTKYAGKPACVQVTEAGYLTGCIDGETVYAHIVAWAIVSGWKPVNEIDHRNLDRANNRWVNLREATRSQQMKNRRAHADSTSQFLGVSFRKDRGVWRANIFAEGKQKFLGTFKDEERAARAYDAAALLYHGDFARLNFPQTSP